MRPVGKMQRCSVTKCLVFTVPCALKRVKTAMQYLICLSKASNYETPSVTGIHSEAVRNQTDKHATIASSNSRERNSPHFPIYGM